jgi:methylmalonyl-CoA epimerase
VRSIDEALRFYVGSLGLNVADRLSLPNHGIDVAFVQAGNTLVELMESTDPASAVARFVERRGPGLHHLCFGTPDIDQHLRDLQASGVDTIDPVARPGAHGDVAFLHPNAAFGVLVELLQEGRFTPVEPSTPTATGGDNPSAIQGDTGD